MVVRSMFVFLTFFICSSLAMAQRVELPSEENQASEASSSPSWKERAKSLDSGRKAATKYMNRKVANLTGDARYMVVQVGYMTNSEASKWGEDNEWKDKAKWNLGVTYRMGEWTNSMDLLFRAELQTFQFDDEKPNKLSFMPIIAFPDSRSRFPLYFGAGIGPGIFLKQVSGESSISLDYNLIVGLRFFDLFDFGGLNIETGLKGHMHLLSDGSFKSSYFNAGMVFSF